MKALFRYCFMLLVILTCLFCSGCQKSESDNIKWDMIATLIRPGQEYRPRNRLNISASYPPASVDHMEKMDFQWNMQSGTEYNTPEITEKVYCSRNPDSSIGNIIYIPSFLYDCKTNAPVAATIGLDWDNECVIILPQTNPTEYIVASTDSSITADELVEHFAAFIALYAQHPQESTEP